MEIKYEDWDRIVKQMEQTVKSDHMTMDINLQVLQYAKKERDKCPTPTTSKEEPKNTK